MTNPKNTPTMSQLPAGYVLLAGVAMHISELKKHTTDVQRFQRHLPLMTELAEAAPGSPASFAVLDKVDDPMEFEKSLQEYGELLLGESEELRQ